ncbi:MAG: winged helix-turn-helix domain-containing protein [Lachnospiraceae bacterium]|nr:winged helix-turn-helix domain-containing protein [Lachnospiraceae bacterium]MDE7434432.1 winged helix-turn-helix domain-containing protein [Lachnospiraceae bacterium]
MESKGTIIVRQQVGTMSGSLRRQLEEEGYRIVREKEPCSLPIGDGSLELMVEGHNLKCGEETVHLTPSEYNILYTMLQSPGRVFSRDQLITYALDASFDGYDRTIDTYIKSIRRKIGRDSSKPSCIRTVHGVGYKYVPDNGGKA